MSSTIRDVARRAGVSASTASRVLSGSDHPVAADVRQRVLQAAEELAFTPNAFARGLSKREFHLIGLLIPDIRNPYFVEIARGIEDSASRHGYLVVLCNTDREAEKERGYVEELRAMRAGMIFAGSAIEQEAHLRDLATHPAPIVAISRHELPCSSVLTDSFQGALDATTHLIQLGHRRIAFVGGPPNTFSSVDRLEGFRLAMAQNGIPVDEELVVDGDYTMEGGAAAFRRLMAVRRLPTAIFAANDQTALGVMREARHNGLRIPQDISVVGFDGIAAAAQAEPPLTTIHLSLHHIGQLAAELLLDQLKSGRVEQRSILVKGNLTVRGSTAAPGGEPIRG